MKKTLIAALLLAAASLPAEAQSLTGTLPFYVDATGGQTWKDVADIFGYGLTDALPGSQNFAVTPARGSADVADKVASAPTSSLALGLVKSDFLAADIRLAPDQRKYGKVNWVVAMVAPVLTCVAPQGLDLAKAVILAPGETSVGHAMAKAMMEQHQGATLSGEARFPRDLVAGLNEGKTFNVACGIPYAIVARNLKDKVAVVAAIGPADALAALKLPDLSAGVAEADRPAFRAAIAGAAFYYALISSAPPDSEAGKALTQAMGKLLASKKFLGEIGQFAGRVAPLDTPVLTGIVNDLYALSPEDLQKAAEKY